MAIDTFEAPNTLSSMDEKTKPKPPIISIPGLSSGEAGNLLLTLIWDLFSIGSRLKNIRNLWAGMADITGPQWNILTATDYLDTGDGVSVGEIANKLHVKSTFVTAQSKLMESGGHLHRRMSRKDKRIVLLSLTPQAIDKVNAFYDIRRRTDQMMFGAFSGEEFQQLVKQVEAIRDNAERALIQLNSHPRSS